MYPVFVGRTAFPTRPAANSALPLPECANAPEPAFRLLDGPPYANGALHLGHVMGLHLKDAVVRAALASGHATAWQPGWDCHGLPVELQVERQCKEYPDDAAFVTACRHYAESQVEQQRHTMKQQGLAADCDHPYRTMDPQQEAATLRVFARLVEAGHVRLRSTPAWWCTECGSTLAQAEQEELEQTVHALVVPFSRPDGSSLLVWTTTPWTLPYHAALVAHPDALYGEWDVSGRRVWCALDSWPRVAAWYDWPLDQAPDRQVTGSDLATAYTTPWGTDGVLRTDTLVQPGGGTGFLHVVPDFAIEDAELGRRWDLPLAHCLNEKGAFNDNAQFSHRGLTVAEVSRAVCAQAAGWPLARSMGWAQTVPSCWRHKCALLVRPSRQVYFVLSERMQQHARLSLKEVAFTPESARARLLDAMSNRPDWCLSRQRRWGVPVALFVHRQTGDLHPDTVTLMHKVADAVAEHGVEVWWQRPDDVWLGEDALCYERVPDVLDVWFDSGCVFATTTDPTRTPDVVLEGHDQYRGWFQSSLWVAAGLGLPAPFKRVVVHGFLLGADGKKLSKSAGGDQKNGAAPDWHTVSSDVVRVWALQSAVHADKRWSQAEYETARDRVVKWRNTVRFVLANSTPHHLQGQVNPSGWHSADRWAVWMTQEVCRKVLQWCMEGYFEKAVNAFQELATETLSRDFFGMLKDRLYCDAEHGPERTAAREALAVVGGQVLTMLKVLAPRLAAEAEHHAGEWPALEVDLAAETNWETCLASRRQVASLWAEESEEHGGSVQCAGASVPRMRDVSSSDWLVWLGTSEVSESASGSLNAYRLTGVTCPRCRWVVRTLRHGVCERCHARCEADEAPSNCESHVL